MSPEYTFGIEVVWTEEQLRWGRSVATPACGWRCQLSKLPEARRFYTQTIEGKPPCEACDAQPFVSIRHNVRYIRERLGQGTLLPSARHELETAKAGCAEGPALQVTLRSPCIVGHMAYAMVCFVHYFGADVTTAFIHLESAMDIATYVQDEVGGLGACGDWGFTPAEIAWNYELHLDSHWHGHSLYMPQQLYRWQDPPPAVPAEARCPRRRPAEPHEVGLLGSPGRCAPGVCEKGGFLASASGSSLAWCEAECQRLPECRWFSFCPGGSCFEKLDGYCVLYDWCENRAVRGVAGAQTCRRHWDATTLAPPLPLIPGASYVAATPAAVLHAVPAETPAELRPETRAAVRCMVLLRLPAEMVRAATVAATYAVECDSLFFVTASTEAGLGTLYGYPVLNIREHYPEVPVDPSHETTSETINVNAANTISKALHMVLLADGLARNDSRAGRRAPDVTCRLDGDTFFVPDNLRRIMACRGFAGEQLWALGHVSYVHKLQAPGVAFTFGGSGVCLSRGALEAFGQLHAAGGVEKSSDPGSWATGRCVAGPGHWDDVALGVCLKHAKVPLSRWHADCRGRELFWPLEYAEALQAKPPGGPTRVALATSEGASGAFNFWRYRALQHFDCRQRRWLGDFPVSWHGRDDRNGSVARRLHAALRSTRGQRVPGGGALRRWDGRVTRAACEDLTC